MPIVVHVSWEGECYPRTAAFRYSHYARLHSGNQTTQPEKQERATQITLQLPPLQAQCWEFFYSPPTQQQQTPAHSYSDTCGWESDPPRLITHKFSVIFLSLSVTASAYVYVYLAVNFISQMIQLPTVTISTMQSSVLSLPEVGVFPNRLQKEWLARNLLDQHCEDMWYQNHGSLLEYHLRKLIMFVVCLSVT